MTPSVVPFAASEDLPGVRCHRGKLLYRDWIFQEGDDVVVQPHDPRSGGGTAAAYVAVVVAVTSTELFVLSETGVFARVVLVDLRLGRVSLRTLTSEQNGVLASS